MYSKLRFAAYLVLFVVFFLISSTGCTKFQEPDWSNAPQTHTCTADQMVKGRVSNHGWKSACKAAGLDGITFHCLRHTFATWHVLNGTPLEVLKDLGGWADIKMVLRYAHMAESHIKQYANNAKAKG